MSQKEIEINEKRKNTDQIEFVNKDESLNNNKNERDIEINIIDFKGNNITRLKRTKRCCLFIVFVILNLIINMDNGTVPALIDEIVIELDISKDILGLFGSLQYGGNLLGNYIFYHLVIFIEI